MNKVPLRGTFSAYAATRSEFLKLTCRFPRGTRPIQTYLPAHKLLRMEGGEGGLGFALGESPGVASCFRSPSQGTGNGPLLSLNLGGLGVGVCSCLGGDTKYKSQRGDLKAQRCQRPAQLIFFSIGAT